MNNRISNAVRLALALSAGGIVFPGAVLGQAPATPAAAAEAPPTDEIIVIGRQRSAAEEIVQERIAQEVVVDIIGAEQISRVGDSSVSLALRRLPGVTLVSDQFIYIRGLGERYSSTTLNGAYVPSPDLTRNVIPLDLFPAEIIQSLTINKGFTADRPAAFGGGNVDIRTTGMPEEPVMKFAFGSGWNSERSSNALTYRGGSDDNLGTDDGTRALPTEIGNAIQTYRGSLSQSAILAGLSRDGQAHSIAEADQINRQLATSLNRDIDFEEGSTDPDFSGEVALGNSWYIDEAQNWRFGALALGDYGNQWREKNRTTRSVGSPDTDFDRTRQTVNKVSLTGSLNLGVEFTADHRVEATGIYLRNTDDEASLRLRNNFNFLRSDGRQLRYYGLRYEERELELLQFRGSHTLGDDTLDVLGLADMPLVGFLRDLNVSWYNSSSTARTDIPNEVLVSGIDQVDPLTGDLISTSVRGLNTSAEYRFTELEDEVQSYGWSVAKPLEFGDSMLTVTAGQDLSQKGRGYLQTQLGLGTTSANAQSVLQGTPGQVLADANILNPVNGFILSLGGLGTESYIAAEAIDATFGKVDLNLNDSWRFSGGLRWENFRQIAVPVDQYQFSTSVPKIRVPIDQIANLRKDEDDYYPSFAVTYKMQDFWAEDFQLRFGWSETVARADLREVSPTIYIDPLNDARIQGNPNLVSADLANFDVRAEWFFSSGDNLTLSLFYKDIKRPIETVEGGGSDNDLSLTFINAESAKVYGIEAELLKNLGFLADRLGAWTDAFFLAGNITLSDSEISIGSQALSATNNERRMTQHAPVVANVQLGYDAPNRAHSATLVYNFVDERLYYGGRAGAPDAFEKAINSLDLVYTFYPTDILSLKLRAQNLLGENTEVVRGGVTTLEQELGTTLKLDVTFDF